MSGKRAINLGFIGDLTPRLNVGVHVRFFDNDGIAAARGRVAEKTFTYAEIRTILGTVPAGDLEEDELNVVVAALKLLTSLQLRGEYKTQEFMKHLRDLGRDNK